MNVCLAFIACPSSLLLPLSFFIGISYSADEKGAQLRHKPTFRVYFPQRINIRPCNIFPAYSFPSLQAKPAWTVYLGAGPS